MPAGMRVIILTCKTRSIKVNFLLKTGLLLMSVTSRPNIALNAVKFYSSSVLFNKIKNNFTSNDMVIYFKAIGSM